LHMGGSRETQCGCYTVACTDTCTKPDRCLQEPLWYRQQLNQ
jgi:hypothetical protein